MADDGEDLSPSLAGSGPDEDFSPTLGTPAPARRGGRAWWRNLKGPIAVLLADLEAPSPLVRRRAAEALVRLRDRRAVPALAQAVRDKSWEVRRACALALGRLGGDGAAAALRIAARDGHAQVRLTAAEALAALGDVGAVPLLEEVVRHMGAFGTKHEQERAESALAALRRRAQ